MIKENWDSQVYSAVARRTDRTCILHTKQDNVGGVKYAMLNSANTTIAHKRLKITY